MTDFRLDGHRVLVTGAGRGLGKAIADSLFQAGAKVFGTSRDATTAGLISARYGTPELLLEMANIDSMDNFVADLQERSGGIDMLVNNAGINIPKAAVEVTSDDWNRVFEANLAGPFFLSTALARSWMKTATAGAIVNVASQAGIVAIEDRAVYGTSKAALIHLTKGLALEWAPHRIRVNAIAPTFVRTELTEATLSRADWSEVLLSRIPLGRFGEPEDVAGSVVFLLGDSASMITGHTLTIDGGYTIH